MCIIINNQLRKYAHFLGWFGFLDIMIVDVSTHPVRDATLCSKPNTPEYFPHLVEMRTLPGGIAWLPIDASIRDADYRE